MIPEEEFKQGILGEYPHSETEMKLRDLAQEYHDRTEAFDRTVCTGPIWHGGIMPANGQERSLINKHAKEVRDMIYREALKLGFTTKRIREAIAHHGRGKLWII